MASSFFAQFFSRKSFRWMRRMGSRSVALASAEVGYPSVVLVEMKLKYLYLVLKWNTQNCSCETKVVESRRKPPTVLYFFYLSTVGFMVMTNPWHPWGKHPRGFSFFLPPGFHQSPGYHPECQQPGNQYRLWKSQHQVTLQRQNGLCGFWWFSHLGWCSPLEI